ncbi:hypothetical protein LguiB_009573 [Lonicera macranthoides]
MPCIIIESLRSLVIGIDSRRNMQRIGWKWASNVVGASASLGIITSLLVVMLGQARYLCVIGRARLVPAWLAKVHPSTGTPLNATLLLGVCQATIALFTELDIVIEMIFISTITDLIG